MDGCVCWDGHVMRASAEFADIIIFGGPFVADGCSSIALLGLSVYPFPFGWHMFVEIDRQTG